MDKTFFPTSKKLTWVFSIFYILACIASFVIKVIYDKDVTVVLGYILPLESIIIVAYFGKSSLENYTQIKNTITSLTDTQMKTTSMPVSTNTTVNPVTTNEVVNTNTVQMIVQEEPDVIITEQVSQPTDSR